MGTYAGSALSTLSLLVAMAVGWRLATAAASATGVVAAALAYSFVERPPRPRGSIAPSLAACLGEALRHVRRVGRLAALYGATSVRMAATTCLWTRGGRAGFFS